MILHRLSQIFKDEAGLHQYPADYVKQDLYSMAALTAADEIHNSFRKQYVQYENRFNSPTLLRPSCIGSKFLFDILYSKFVTMPAPKYGEQTKLNFFIGDVFEQWVGFTLERLGYKIDRHTSYPYHGMDCHPDFIVIDELGHEYVLEVKTTNNWYFNKVRACGVTDDRGYLSQLLIYELATGRPGVWLFYNKDSGDMMLIPLEDVLSKAHKEYLTDYIHYVCEMYQSVLNVKEVYELADPPPPKIEKDKYGNHKYDKEGNPILYVSPKCCFPDLYYLTETKKDRRYIKSFVEAYSSIDPYQLAKKYDDSLYQQEMMVKKHYLKLQ